MHIVVAIYEPSFWTIPEEDVRRLRALLPGDVVTHARNPAELAAVLSDADVILGTRVTREEFTQARRLQWLHSTAVGVGNLLHPEMVSSAIPLTNSRGVHAEPIAEHAIALLLALRRGLHLAVRRQLAREWAQQEMYDRLVTSLGESVMTVVGLGAIGARIAAHAHALGVRVLGVRRDTSAARPPGLADVYPAERLRDALAVSDAVVLALPHMHGAAPLMGREEFAAMKPGAFLVNIARGQLIDDTALLAALDANHLGGAALDAFVPEPLPETSPLWRAEKVLITPHTAAFGINYWRPAIDLFVLNRRRFADGLPLLNVVDKARGY